MVAAGCMVLYGYDAAVFNAVQGNTHWKAYYNNPQNELLGLINTSYSIGAICAGLFKSSSLFSLPFADQTIQDGSLAE